MTPLDAAKRALRKQTAATLSLLSGSVVQEQSRQVLMHLSSFPAYVKCRSATVYLSMGGEVDTWPILEDLLARGVTVAVPRVTGPNRSDMTMLQCDSIEQARAFPKTKWGISEPSAALAAEMTDMTNHAFDLLIVPGVAFDSGCHRLGHGKAYYDTFISKQLEGGGYPAVVGLALECQLIESVPVGEFDQRLDAVIHPAGALGYASRADEARAPALLADGSKRQREGESSTPEKQLLRLEERVDLSEGKWKYVCLRASSDAGSCILVRSAPGTYHMDVAEPAIEALEAQGFEVEPLGGGRIRFAPSEGSVHVYGYSVGLGGEEGGPPGHGMRDHAEVAELIRRRYPAMTTTWAAEGY